MGKPLHMKTRDNLSACGIVNPEYGAFDARDCTCLRCIKTQKYKIYTTGTARRLKDE